MDLRPLLHCFVTWILRMTPTKARESNGEAQEDFWTGAGSAGGECSARSAGDIDRRTGGGSVRSRDVLGHGGVWASQGRAVAAVSAAGTRDSQPRHLQPRV